MCNELKLVFWTELLEEVHHKTAHSNSKLCEAPNEGSSSNGPLHMLCLEPFIFILMPYLVRLPIGFCSVRCQAQT